MQTFDLGGGATAEYLAIVFRRQIGAEDIAYHVEFATELSGWNEPGVRAGAGATLHFGTVTDLRSSIAASA